MSRWVRSAGVATFVCYISIVFITATAPATAGESQFIRRNYAKFEYSIPMRDGIKLFTIVYVPKKKKQKYPILLLRTPYSVPPYGKDSYIDEPGRLRTRLFHEGYIMAYQDVRGRYMSEGEYVDVRPYLPVKQSPLDIDETTDTYDTVDWLIKNVPQNNGRVGISGISYPGFYSSMGMIDAHPAVKAVSPQAPVSKWMGGDDFFHNGALLLSHAFDFYSWFGWPRSGLKSELDKPFGHRTPDGYKFFMEIGPLPNANAKYLRDGVAFWNEIMQHGTWDAFWEARNILPHLKNIKPAVLVVGGWFDTENLFGALHTYEAINRQSPESKNTLVMGPWFHGGWDRSDGQKLGDIDFGAKTSDYYLDRIEAPFFNFYLKDQGKPDPTAAFVFETGANQWHSLDSWPPGNLETRDLFLRADGALSWQPPTGSANDYREYVSDPAKAVPYTSEIVHWYNPAFMIQDQRFASTRPDVLVYQSDPLPAHVTVAGPILVDFFVSTSGTDSDWIVKLIDVLPDDTPNPDSGSGKVQLGGYQMMVRGDLLRGKFRNSMSVPEPFVPGQVTRIEFELQDVFHTFKEGHRIMVQVQSTWFPMIDLNPQKFVDIYHAQESDFQKAIQRVYSTRECPSHLSLGLLKR